MNKLLPNGVGVMLLGRLGVNQSTHDQHIETRMLLHTLKQTKITEQTLGISSWWMPRATKRANGIWALAPSRFKRSQLPIFDDHRNERTQIERRHFLIELTTYLNREDILVTGSNGRNSNTARAKEAAV